jgi:hypothetical protein
MQLWLSILHYLTFFLLSLTNLHLWRYIKARTLTASARVEGWKHFRISLIYAVSFVYKGVYANLIYSIHADMENFMSEHTEYWCIFFFWLIVCGELAPLALLFWYQLRRNLYQARKKPMSGEQERFMSTSGRDDSSAMEVEEDRKGTHGNDFNVIYDIEDDGNGQASTNEYDYKS